MQYSAEAAEALYHGDHFAKGLMTFQEYNTWTLEVLAWEAYNFGEDHELTDDALNFLGWPMTNQEIRDLIAEGLLTEATVWKAIGEKANQIRQPHLWQGEAIAFGQLGA